MRLPQKCRNNLEIRAAPDLHLARFAFTNLSGYVRLAYTQESSPLPG